jgi:hypothetical protein
MALLVPRKIDDNENLEFVLLALLSTIMLLGLGTGLVKLVGINFIQVLSVKTFT